MGDYDDISIRLSAWRRVPWLTIAAMVLGSAVFLWFDPCEILVADNEHVPDDAVQLQDQAIRAPDPDVFQTKGSLNLLDGGILEFQYCPISDSGVQLHRFDQNGRLIWKQKCASLGVGHSKYSNRVFVFIEENTVKVISRGSQGTFVERLSLSSGRRWARSVRN